MGKRALAEQTYELEKIVARRMVGRRKEYLVKWLGYPSHQNTWEPLAHLEGVMEDVRKFEKSLLPKSPAAVPSRPSAKATSKQIKTAPSPALVAKRKKPPPEKPKSVKHEPSAERVNKASEAQSGKRARESDAPHPKPKVAKPAPKGELKATKPSAKSGKPKDRSKAVLKAIEMRAKNRKAEPIDIVSISRLLMESISGKIAKVFPDPNFTQHGAAKEKKAKANEVKKAKARREKTAKANEEKKAKANENGEGMAEVQKILGMRVDAAGGLEFQIQWKQRGKIGKTTWEPEEHIMDDSLVEAFEEEQQINVYGGEDIKTGSEVEVKNVAEGFQNSWTLANVTSRKGGKYWVCYSAFVDDKGNHEVEKSVDRSRLRLVPPKVEGWAPVPGEIIEVSEDDCWWEARVKSVKGKTLSVVFRVSDEEKEVALGSNTRPCSWFKLLNKK